MNWQPIETAPKDGSTIMLTVDGEQLASGYWSRLSDAWFSFAAQSYLKPEFWMPLPPPPTR